MIFIERVTNMVYDLYFDFAFVTFNKKKWDKFYSKVSLVYYFFPPVDGKKSYFLCMG